MQFLMWNAKIAELWSSFSRTRSPEIVHTVKKRFTTIGKILVVDSGVHLHHRMLGTFAQNLKDQKTDFTGMNMHNHPMHRMQKAAALLINVVLQHFSPLHDFVTAFCTR